MDGSSGATQNPALTAPEEGVGEGHRVADDEADGGEATGADPSEEAPPPVHVLFELAEGQRPAVASVLDVGPIAQQHRAGADDIAEGDVRLRRAAPPAAAGILVATAVHQYIIRGSA